MKRTDTIESLGLSESLYVLLKRKGINTPEGLYKLDLDKLTKPHLVEIAELTINLLDKGE